MPRLGLTTTRMDQLFVSVVTTVVQCCWIAFAICTAGIPVVVMAQSPLTMNGGSVLAMTGKNCIAVAVDKRFGRDSSLINICSRRPVLHFPDSTLVAFTGLESDVQSLRIELVTQVARKYNRGLGFSSFGIGSDLGVSVRSVASLTSHVLYHRKQSPYYVEPLVVGLEPDGWVDATSDTDDNESSKKKSEDSGQLHTQTRDLSSSIPAKQRRYRPFLCSMDLLGARSESQSFVCAGTATESIFGTAEALWKPDLTPEQLLPICCKAFLSALERDCLSGYGAVVYMITPDGIVEHDVTGRND